MNQIERPEMDPHQSDAVPYHRKGQYSFLYKLSALPGIRWQWTLYPVNLAFNLYPCAKRRFKTKKASVVDPNPFALAVLDPDAYWECGF